MKKLFIRPAEQRVVVLPDEKVEKTTGMGIILPSTVEDNAPEIATIIAVGTGEKDHPMLYHKGQRVIYSQYSGVEVNLDLIGAKGEKVYKVMNQLDIMAVIEEED
jgi:chaperonin GroES